MDDIDPTTVRSLEELAACLRRVHVRAGKPTYRSLEDKTKFANELLSGTQLKQVRLTRATLNEVLLGRKFPGKAFMLTFVGVCGIDIKNDHRWEQTWDRLAIQDQDQADETGAEQLRKQLVEADARAEQAVREADELRRQLTYFQKSEPIRPAAIPFWDILDPTEREVLRSVASIRSFAGGAAIMQQGEQADYVLVILGGRASIRINENGSERVLAERGPGQLIGERAALQVSVRSATVVALETILALVVQTRDFAAFVTDHPHILAFVEDQRHDRGTDDPDGHDHRDSAGFNVIPVDGMAMGQPDGVPTGPQPSFRGENCTVIITDIVAFGAHKRTDEDRRIIREALFEMTQAAMRGIADVRSQDRGDGILIVIPPNIPTVIAMDQLLRVLPSALNQHNSSQRNAAQVQLRLSVNVGPVVSDTVGLSGEAIIIAARLVEASAFKEAFVGSTTRLGIIASQFVYDTVIRHSKDQDYVASYSKVPVEVKEFRTTAWMKLIG